VAHSPAGVVKAEYQARIASQERCESPDLVVHR
jgi:hypothetical protein